MIDARYDRSTNRFECYESSEDLRRGEPLRLLRPGPFRSLFPAHRGHPEHLLIIPLTYANTMRLSVLFCGVMLLAAGPSFAQSNVTVYVDGGPGISNQPEQFGEFYSTGARVGGGVGYAITPSLEVLLRAHYETLPFDTDGVKTFLVEGLLINPDDTGGTQVDGPGADVLSSSINLKINSTIGTTLGFYLAGGAGIYHHDLYGVNVDFPAGFEEESFEFSAQEETNFGFNIGFGFSLPVTENIDARVEPQFIFVFSGEGEETVPAIERTGNISYIPIQFGLSWSL